MKAKQINKIIDYGIMVAGAYFVGSAIAGAIKRKKEGVGKVERIKRRIYKEVSLAQDAGVDFSKKYSELTADEKKALEHVGKDVVGWKQSKRSIESGKPYTESYFGSLRRAWNAVSGIEGIGRAYNVKDANGNICLTWIEDAAAHVEAEAKVLEAEERAAQARKRLYKTRRAMQRQPVAPVAPAVLTIPEEPKALSKKELKQAAKLQEYAERKQFAEDWINKHAKELFNVKLHKENYKGKWNIDDVAENAGDALIETFARGELKVTRDSTYYAGDKFGYITSITDPARELLDSWREYEIRRGFDNPELNNIRRALLDKAKHMVVKTPDGDIRGDDRYNYLNYMNYVIMVKKNYYNRAADTHEITIYPLYTLSDFDLAEGYVHRYNRRFKDTSLSETETYYQIPIWEVDIQSISGIGYAPAVEAELYEIWREKIEYGETEYDYDTWRKVVGDEYAKDVLKYMR